jgi:DNA-directed RNA polymerase specialized sigma24 family protein
MPDDEFFIRRFAAARDAADATAAAAVWEDLVTRSYDRIAGFVRLHRFPGGSGLPHREWQDATQCAFMRVLGMHANFRGTTGAEYRAAVKKAVWFACMDYGRELLAHEKGIAASLDERYEGDGDGAAIDATLARWLDARAAAAEEAADDIAFVRWAIEQIPNDDHRAVVRMCFDGVPKDEIADAMQIGMANVYQRHSRGMRELKRIIRDNAP